jgi:D-glycero-alpha-D-manno-heptose-7-phosphate kinase
VIITRTPFRISLFGGGSDFPAHYRQHGGTCLGFALNQYCWLQVRHLPPFFSHRHRVVHSRIELVRAFREIEHPAARAILTSSLFNSDDVGIEIHHTGDLPARSGLGSSSAFTVGLLNALAALAGRRLTKEVLAGEAIRLEQDVMGEAVGSQDQVFATYGGFNQIDFTADGFRVNPVLIPPERERALLDRLMLVFTGVSRFAVAVEAEKIAQIDKIETDLSFLRVMACEAETVLTQGGDLDAIGEMLHRSWLRKRQLTARVSSPHLDTIYDRARAAGALGGKLLGAGGGGFFLFYIKPESRQDVKNALSELIEVPVGIDRQGSTVVI